MNRLRLTEALPATARSALATCSSIPRTSPGPVVAVLVVDHPIGMPRAFSAAGGRPRLGDTMPIGDLLTRVLWRAIRRSPAAA